MGLGPCDSKNIYFLSLFCEQAAFVNSLAVLCKLVSALGALAGADLSLAQFAQSAEQQALWVGGCRLLLSMLCSALDGPNQTHIAGAASPA